VWNPFFLAVHGLCHGVVASTRFREIRHARAAPARRTAGRRMAPMWI
ncbi:unnamed protein product, partial [Acidocella sp. C78]